ncbi:MAG: DUF6111 family protein [Rickettsiales bacterium]|nr:DUF6111 family protein [Rickettsiales bacterium]
MIRFLLTKFWPALIPIALYLLWFAYKRHKLRHSDEVVRITDGPWLVTLITAMFIAAAGFIWLGLVGEKTGPATYTPAIMKDGKIVQGEVKSNADER